MLIYQSTTVIYFYTYYLLYHQLNYSWLLNRTVRQSAWFGTKRPEVQILSLLPFVKKMLVLIKDRHFFNLYVKARIVVFMCLICYNYN